MIDIKKKDGTLRCSVEITDQCIYHKELMTEEYVSLSFVSDTVIPFAKGDYIETEFGTFKIINLEVPTIENDGSYKYEQKFHPHWEQFKTRIMFYDRQQGFEKSWKMTQRPEYFLDILVSNIRNAGFGSYTFEVDASLTEMKLIEFDGTSILDALTKIAEAWETEWWITDNVIHLCKCEYGDAVPLTLNDEVTTMEPSNGQDSTYITRLYAFGSTRNLRKNYRKDEDSDAVIEGVVETRLKLPEGTPYVDAWENMAAEDIVEGVAIFDDIYPHRVGSISSVSTKEYTDTIENEDGTETKEKWKAYRFTDAGITFSKDYVIPGEELRITFQTGKLAGMDFAVTFNPDGWKEVDAKAQVYEIVRNEDYGIALPSDDFKPSVGDTYVLYGYDTKFVADKLESIAEAELLAKAIEKVAETSKDNLVHDCNTDPIRCAGYTERNGILEYDPADVIDLDVGQLVTLHSVDLLSTGSKISRVRAFEKSLSNKFICKYTIGKSSTYSKREELNEKVETLTHQTKEFTNAYGVPIYAIKSHDNTTPTDHNVYSARRANKQFARKDVPDTFQGVMTFKEGAMFGDFFQSLYGGVGAGVDKQGNAEFESVRVRSFLECLELIINRLSAVEGDMVLTEGDTVEHVEDLGNKRYRLHLKRKWDGYFTAQVVNNVLKGVVNTLAEGSGTYQTSWLRVDSVNTAENYIEAILYPDSDTPSGKNFPPVELMNITRWGNQSDKTRQSCIYLSSTEGRIMRLTGVTAPKLTAANYGTTLGTLPEFLEAMNLPTIEGQDYLYARGLVVQDIIRMDYQGNPQATIVDRGAWAASQNYYCNAYNEDSKIYETSDVWHYGCRYRCAKTGTTTEPCWGNTDWAMVEGNPDIVAEFSEPSIVCNFIALNAQLSLIIKAYNQDISEKIIDSNVSWTRYSEDAEGNQRVELDTAWNNAHKGIGKTLQLTLEDVDGVPSTLRFTATVEPGMVSASIDVLLTLKGDKGDSGDYTEIRYLSYALPSMKPIVNATVREPRDWSTTMPSSGYIWMISAKINGTTNSLITNWSTPVRITPIDGDDGDYTETRYAVSESQTTSPTLTSTEREPSGWSTTPPSVDANQYLWMTTAKISGVDNSLLAQWSRAVRVSPRDGVDGKTGDYTENRYAVNTTPDKAPVLNASIRNPAGWSIVQPTASKGQYVWMTTAKINGETEAFITRWSAPVRITAIDGARGERGPTLRGPQEWQNLPVGYHFYSGAAGEPYIDIVVHGGYYYSCVTSHNKETASAPGDSSNWQLGDSVELVATKLLLAEYALIKNLGVGAIEMEDKSGIKVFIAKDGNLQCSTGTFENVNIKNGVFGGWTFSEAGMSNVQDSWYDHDIGILCAYNFASALAAIGSDVHSEEDGHRLLARFEHLRLPVGGLENKADKYNVKISTQGSPLRNVAIDIQGGCIQGLAMSNKVVQTSDVSSTSATYVIKSHENNILYTADKKGAVTLPAMQPHDDGHVVRITNLSNYSLLVKANNCYTSYNGSASSPGFMKSDGTFDTTVNIDNKGDSAEFVWVKGVNLSTYASYQGGTWVRCK